jgi:hypothetical protein
MDAMKRRPHEPDNIRHEMMEIFLQTVIVPGKLGLPP